MRSANLNIFLMFTASENEDIDTELSETGWHANHNYENIQTFTLN